MANLTLSIDEEVLKQARIRALEQDTSVNALVRRYLEDLAGRDASQSPMAPFLALARSTHAGGNRSQGRAWRREELHER